MKFNEIFDEIEKDFDKEIAVMCMVILTINLTLKVTLNHLENKESFTKELIESAKSKLWESDPEKIDLAIKVWECIYPWECDQALGGVQGRAKRSLKQIFEEKG